MSFTCSTVMLSCPRRPHDSPYRCSSRRPAAPPAAILNSPGCRRRRRSGSSLHCGRGCSGSCSRRHSYGHPAADVLSYTARSQTLGCHGHHPPHPPAPRPAPSSFHWPRFPQDRLHWPPSTLSGAEPKVAGVLLSGRDGTSER